LPRDENEGPTLDKIKSIAVPITRRSATPSARSRRPVAEAPLDEQRPRMPQHSMVPAAIEPKHRFRVGERVRMIGGGNRWARAESACRIVSLLPHDGGPFLYRVQSEAESYQRVVDEADLSSLR
jgi:hypothetical protein